MSDQFAWDGRDFADPAHYVYVLSKEDKIEINDSLRRFKALGLDGNEITKSNFPLPSLRSKFEDFSGHLHHGRGFFTIRGVENANFTREDKILVFLAISSHIGEKRGRQDEEGNVFAHITQAQYMRESQEERPIRDSNLASLFHVDMFADILAMQTHSQAMMGGNHTIASSARIYNDLAATRPDLVRTLASPDWPFDSRSHFTAAQKRPVLYYQDGRIIMNFVPAQLIGASNLPRQKGLANLSALQLEALQTVEQLAQKYKFSLIMEPGDLTYVNNFALLHAREAFSDSAERKRYLVRMWLKNERLAWTLPEALKEGNRRIFEKNVGIKERWNIVPKVRLRFEIRDRLTP